MRKNKYFIKRKNTLNNDLEFDALSMVGTVLAATGTLASCWLLICMLNAIVN